MVFWILYVAAMAMTVWAVLDAALRPDSLWTAIDQNKIVWIAVALFLPVVGPIAYLVAMRPRLVAADRKVMPWDVPRRTAP